MDAMTCGSLLSRHNKGSLVFLTWRKPDAEAACQWPASSLVSVPLATSIDLDIAINRKVLWPQPESLSVTELEELNRQASQSERSGSAFLDVRHESRRKRTSCALPETRVGAGTR